jgi:hypothetical protein
LAGSYSVTAALGSAAGGRAQAERIETASTGARDRAQAAYDKATADLARIGSTRPVGELEALLAAAQLNPRTKGCAGEGSSSRVTCPKIEAELARARERDRLQAAVDKASGQLGVSPTKVANSDAKALARFMTAVGFDVGPERLNDLLVLLAVLMVECGGGLSLAIGMALSTPAATRPAMSADAVAGQPDQPTASIPKPTTLPAMLADRPATVADIRPAGGRAQWSDAVHPDSEAVVAWLRAAGGRTVGIRPLADALGWPRTTLTERLQRLAGQGLVRLAPGRRGTVVELARAVRAN